MSIKKRNYYMGGKKHTVELKYDGYMYKSYLTEFYSSRHLMNCLRFRFSMRFRRINYGREYGSCRKERS